MSHSAAAANFLDRYIGRALCAALSPFGRRSGAARPAAPRRILLMKFWEGGLITLATPWCRALRRRYPGAEIHFLTLDANAGLCELLGVADSVRPLPAGGGLPAFVLSAAAALPALRRQKYDMLLNLDFFSRFSALLAFLIGPRWACALSLPGLERGAFFDLEIPFARDRHIAENFAAFFAAVGAEAGPEDRRPPRPDPALLRDLPLPDGPFVVLNFDRSDVLPERAWPRGHCLELAGLLLDRTPYKVAAISQRPASLPARPGLFDISGELDYFRLAALFARAELFVTHDCGPLHLAAEMGCRTLSIFGPEAAARYAPRGPLHRSLDLGLPCSPCIDPMAGKRLRCRRAANDCVRGITPQTVFGAITEILPPR